jgi:hypothetical protein
MNRYDEGPMTMNLPGHLVESTLGQSGLYDGAVNCTAQ